MASPQVQQLIQQGAQALKANNKALAKSLLMQATELDERSETAWLYLSAAVDSLEEQQICLENVLAINPTNERARKGLAIIQQKLGKSAAPPPAPPLSLIHI
jgi:Tfp pilus assembly protein PilF